jgi:hypothetical protein
MVFSSSQWWAATGGEAAYVPKGAIWFDGSADYLYRTPSGAGNRKTYSYSFWAKQYKNTTNGYTLEAGSPSGNSEGIRFAGSTDCYLYIDGVDGGGSGALGTTALYRDPTAWYHVLYTKDTTDPVATNRVKLYVNGREVTNFTTRNDPALDAEGFLNNTVPHRIGAETYAATPAQLYGGYLSEAILLDGYAGSPSDFGTEDSNGVWIPKDPTDTVTTNKGTNGFWLDFADSADLGNDVSGNNNDWTLNSITSANWTYDRPADSGSDTGNYATLNILLKTTGTFSNADRTFLADSQVGFGHSITSTQVMTSGTYYAEFVVDSWSGTNYATIGIATTDFVTSNNYASNWTGANTQSWGYYGDGSVYTNGSATSSGYDSFTLGDVIGVKLDATNGAVYFYKDGTVQNSGSAAFSSLTGPFVFSISNAGGSTSCTITANFGQTALSYQPASTSTLATQNQPEVTVTKPSDNFLPILYEGNGGGQRVGNFIPFTDSHTVNYSARFDEGDTDYLSKTFSGAGTGAGEEWTYSVWVKRGALSSGYGMTLFGVNDPGVNNCWFKFDGPSGTVDNGLFLWVDNGVYYFRTNEKITTTQSWVHLVVAVDTNQGSSTDRVKMYINGNEVTSWQEYDTLPSGKDTMFGQAHQHCLGYDTANSSSPCDGYMAESIFVDGYQLTASVFGQTDTSTNRWIPKEVTAATLNTAGGGSSGFGTNGFYFNYSDSAELGDDTSGEGNDFTENNMVAANQTVDTPTKNCATLSPSIGSATLTEGNTKLAGAGGINNGSRSQMAVFDYAYFEVEMIGRSSASPGDGDRNCVGLFFDTSDVNDNLTSNTTMWGVDNGFTPYSAGVAGTNPGLSWAVGEYGCFAIRSDGGSGTNLWVGEDSTSSWVGGGNPVTNTTPTLTVPYPPHELFVGGSCYLSSDIIQFNCGGQTFSQTPPTDFKALSQNNAPENTAGITGLAWLKNIDGYSDHIIQDRVRGVYKYLVENDTDIEATNANSVQKFLQQGVQIGTMATVNTSANSFVLWNWVGNGTGTLNEEGSIDSTVSANTDAGFSIVQYTGTGSAATVGHGLSSAPSFIINKPLASATDNNWQIYHSGIGATKALWLNLANAAATATAYWNDTAPTSTVFSIGTDRDSTVEYINYCFAEIDGYSKFGIYTGNGANDGAFVHTGFKPNFLLIKRTDNANYWVLFDGARSTYNPVTATFPSNYTNPGSASGLAAVDFVSNGFKWRLGVGGSYPTTNYEDGIYTYAAFAEHPFGGSGIAQGKAS